MLYYDVIQRSGLEKRDAEIIQRALWAFPEVERLILYGSRAKGTFDRRSDVDLALYGPRVTEYISARFSDVLTDGLNLFRRVDVVSPAHLHNPRLVEEIEKYGVVIYEKDPASHPA